MTSVAPEMRIFKCPVCDTLHIRKVSGAGEKKFHDCGTEMEDVTDDVAKYGGSALSDCYD